VLRNVLSIVAMLSIALGLSATAVAAPTDGPPSPDYQRALRCMAAAIDYEAGNEPLEGQEAVGQVILNRLRDPAFPKTVCGVVFQGSARRTGCQFTFTCDGSLLRPRSAQSQAQANVVAEHVLAGRNASIVGGATHYHANYVSPYWAPSLVRVATIGAHIFYRRPGATDFAALPPATQFAPEPDIDWLSQRPLAETNPLPASTATLSRGSIFSPWGLPTLQVLTPSRVTALGKGN
jgi:Cell Wall Hydrolase